MILRRWPERRNQQGALEVTPSVQLSLWRIRLQREREFVADVLVGRNSEFGRSIAKCTLRVRKALSPGPFIKVLRKTVFLVPSKP